MSIAQALADLCQQDRVGRISHIVDLMPSAADRAQHVELFGIALWQIRTRTRAHHLRTAVFILAFEAGDMVQVFRIGGIGDINDRGAVELRLTGQRVDRLRDGVSTAVVTHIGNVTIALALNRRLVRTATLEIAVADKTHVHRFGGRTNLLHLG
jgi:hypothetical protein